MTLHLRAQRGRALETLEMMMMIIIIIIIVITTIIIIISIIVSSSSSSSSSSNNSNSSSSSSSISHGSSWGSGGLPDLELPSRRGLAAKKVGPCSVALTEVILFCVFSSAYLHA